MNNQLLKDIQDWREPMTGAVSCKYLPIDYSCDNGVDFTAILCALTETGGPVPWFDYLVLQYEKSPGELLKHPTGTEFMSWDDHMAAASQSTWFARRLLAFAKANHWTWGGRWLWKYFILSPVAHAKAMDPETPYRPWHSLMAAICYFLNCFEGRKETSGKKSLFLALTALWGKSWALNQVIRLWLYVMRKRYPGGLREVMGIYFPPQPKYATKVMQEHADNPMVPHPYSIYSPPSWDIKHLTLGAYIEQLPKKI